MLNKDVPRLMQLLIFLDYLITNQANDLKYIKDRLWLRLNGITLSSICQIKFKINNKQQNDPFQYLATTFLP